MNINFTRLPAIALLVLLAGCATPPPPQRVIQADADVYYSGMSLVAGTMAAIPPRFPVLYRYADGVKVITRDAIKKQTDSFSQISLLGFGGELAEGDEAIGLVCAFTGEKYFSKAAVIGGEEIQNVTAYLGGALMLQRSKIQANQSTDVQLLACYPFRIICLGLVESGKSPVSAGGKLLLGSEIGLRSDAFQSVIQGLAGKVAPVTGLGATMQVRNINIGEGSSQLIADKFEGDENEFRQWLAGELGAQLATQIGVPVIPYAEDTSTRKMAQMMENGVAYNIRLPEPDFVVDFDLAGFSKAKAKETVSESLWVYGAYGQFTISEADTGRVRWQKEIKAGVPTKIAATQTLVDQSFAQFSALLKLLGTLPGDLLADKTARPILDACLK
jgi:hypothetical protein